MRNGWLFSTVAAATLGLAGSVLAADMPVKAPPPPPPVVFSWTGFYLGGNIGAAWAHSNWNDITRRVVFGVNNNSHFLAGGQVGYNWQINNFLLGVEADADWLSRNNNNGIGVVVPGVAGPIAVSSDRTWIATAAARFGITADRALFYGKAGGGWVGENNLTIANLGTGAVIAGTGSRSRGGFLLGGGIEYAVTNNWTIKAEYDWIDIKGRTFIVPGGSPFLVGDTFTSSGRNVQEAKIGFNYLFSTGAPAAPHY
jgi:outer membrane immunogenic protein